MDTLYYASFDARDAFEQAGGLHDWQQQYEQLSGGTFAGHVDDLCIGPVQVFHERLNQTVFQVGAPRPGSVTVAQAGASATPGWFCGHTLAAGRIFAMPADVQFELTVPAGMDLLAVSIDREALRAAAARLGRELPLPPRPCVAADGAVDAGAFRELALCALDLAGHRPQLLDKPAARAMLERSLAEALLEALPAPSLAVALPRSAAAQRRIVAAARDFVRAHADEAITVPQLCGVAGVSRRGLQYAFEHVLQLNPVAYVRAVRLGRVRAELLAGGAEPIGDIAARWGFWHLSRFAADYRALYGELPSATRGRRPGTVTAGG